jgi:tRNA A37 methylthiotransferase MiaB
VICIIFVLIFLPFFENIGVSISSDFIAGFCEETLEEHNATVDLMNKTVFDQAFMFAYSLRERTHAAHRMKDDVPQAEKLRRLQEIISAYRDNMQVSLAGRLYNYIGYHSMEYNSIAS